MKYLERIRLSRSPSNSPWNSYYYRRADGNHIQKLPLQSIILTPPKNTQVHTDRVTSEDKSHTLKVQGVAYSGGENTRIKKVEITVDEGKNWQEANILRDDVKIKNIITTLNRDVQDEINTNHAWVRFEADVTISISSQEAQNGKIYIHSRATDSKGSTQPKKSLKQRGYLYNGWGKTSIVFTPERGTAPRNGSQGQRKKSC